MSHLLHHGKRQERIQIPSVTNEMSETTNREVPGMTQREQRRLEKKEEAAAGATPLLSSNEPSLWSTRDRETTAASVPSLDDAPPTMTAREERRLAQKAKKHSNQTTQDATVAVSATVSAQAGGPDPLSSIMTAREKRRIEKEQQAKRGNTPSAGASSATSASTPTPGGAPTARERRRMELDDEEQAALANDSSEDEPDPDATPGAYSLSRNQQERQTKGRLTSAPLDEENEIDLRQAPDNKDSITAQVALVRQESRRHEHRTLYIALALLLTLGVAGGIVAAVLLASGQNPSLDTESPTDAPSTDAPSSPPTILVVPICENFEDINVNVRSTNNQEYMALLPFVQGFFPDHSVPITPTDYCSPVHLAHSWLVTDQLRARSVPTIMGYRFLLSYFYIYWGGGAVDEDGRDLLAGWLSDDSYCLWAGISCGEDGILIGWDYDDVLLGATPNRGLIYDIPTAIGHLTDLRTLNLRSNAFVGQVPTAIGHLINLELLNLSRNQLTGKFPFPSISSMTNLRILMLGNAGAALQTSIPSEIGEISNLEYLSIARTDSSSSLPTEIARLTTLVGLNTRFGGLTGTIPSELGLLQDLSLLDLGDNQIVGEIPTTIGMMTNLKWLYLPGNLQISGTLPTEIGNLDAFERLVIDGASLDGIIPSEIGRCTSLDTLVLADLFLEGTLPDQIGQLTNLVALSFSNSIFLTGTLPLQFLWQFPNLATFSARGTSMSGFLQIDTQTLSLPGCLDFYDSDIIHDFSGDICATSESQSLWLGDRGSPCHCFVDRFCSCESRRGCNPALDESCAYARDPFDDILESGFFVNGRVVLRPEAIP